MDGEFMGAYSIFQDIQEIDQLNSKIKHLEMQVSLTKPEADFQHVVHMGTMQNIYKQAKKIVGSLGVLVTPSSQGVRHRQNHAGKPHL